MMSAPLLEELYAQVRRVLLKKAKSFMGKDSEKVIGHHFNNISFILVIFYALS
jgi:hypothetical protein